MLDRVEHARQCVPNLVKTIGKKLSEDARAEYEEQPVKVCLCADEVADLAEVSTVDDPTEDHNRARTLLTTFTSAWTNLGTSDDTFLILLSTQPRLTHLAAPRNLQESQRYLPVAQKAYHHAPWTELPFDVLMPSPFFTPGTKTLTDISEVAFIAQFGRPLYDLRSYYIISIADELIFRWRTRYQAAPSKRLQDEGNIVQEGIVEFAFTKLTGFDFDTFRERCDPYAAHPTRIAILATRLLVDLDMTREAARSAEVHMVERSMRVVFSIPAHREYMRSGTPSEPILAAAAAHIWQNPERFKFDSGEVVQELIRHGLVEKGARAELIARYLLLLAYDRAAVAVAKKKNSTLELKDTRQCEAVPVLDFLEALFASHFRDDIRACMPDGVNEGFDSNQLTKLEDAFQNAFVRFNHFVRNGPDNVLDTHAALAAVVRGMAIQCEPSQKAVDIAIPIVLGGMDVGLRAEMMSYILIQVKDRHRERTLAPIDVDKLQAFPDTAPNTNPLITITMQLGDHTAKRVGRPRPRPRTPQPLRHLLSTLPSEVTAKLESDSGYPLRHPKVAHPRYEINVTGCSPTVYGVVESKDKFAEFLASRDLFEEHTRAARSDNLGILKAVKRLKAEWWREPAHYDWIDDSASTEEWSSLQCQETVVTGSGLVL